MKIFHKLFLILTAVSAVPLALAATLLIWRAAADQREVMGRISETWHATSKLGGESLSAQAWHGHRQLVYDKAQMLETAFETIRRGVQLEALVTRQALAQDSAQSVRQRLAALEGIFDHNQKAIPWCLKSYVWHRDGTLVASEGYAFKPGYDPTMSYWFKKVSDKKRLVWTKMYRNEDGDIVITYADPIYDAEKKLLAVAAIDIRVTDLLDQLFDLRSLPVTDALIMDFKGRVRASATYDGKVKLNLAQLLEDKPPRVEDFRGGEFTEVYRAIAQERAKDSEVVPAAGGKELFTYSKIKVGMSDAKSMDWYYVVKTPLAPILKPVNDMTRAFAVLESSLTSTIERQRRRRLLLLVAVVTAVLLLAGLLAWLIAKATVRPLQRTAEAVARIAKGDFDVRLPPGSSDEVGQVQSAINDMAAELKKGVFIQSSFKRYVAPSVVEALLKDPGKLALGGGRRVMTVFFSDVTGFTALSESMSPEALVELINEYLSAMTLCIFGREGTIDKYEGDAVMAFWSAPLEQPDHATRACLAALDCYTALEALNGKWRKEGRAPLEMRVGINTGPMIVGNMGSMVKMDYSVLGDSVNLGSRLEGANRAYGTKILVGEETYLAAAAAVEAREVDLLAVLGKKKAVRVYELLAPKGGLDAGRLGGYRLFEQGLEAYRAKRWEQAEAAFLDADRRLGGDSVSKLFLKRIADWRLRAPPEQWDGSYSLTFK